MLVFKQSGTSRENVSYQDIFPPSSVSFAQFPELRFHVQPASNEFPKIQTKLCLIVNGIYKMKESLNLTCR